MCPQCNSLVRPLGSLGASPSPLGISQYTPNVTPITPRALLSATPVHPVYPRCTRCTPAAPNASGTTHSLCTPRRGGC